MSSALKIVPLVLLLGAPAFAAPQDDAAAKRLLSAAEQREDTGDLDGARRDLELFVERFSGSSYAAEANMRLASIFFRSGDLASAERVSRELIASHGRSRFASGAQFLLAEILVSRAQTRADIDAARIAFRNVWLLFGTEGDRGIPSRAGAQVRDGELALRFGSADEAASRFVAAIEGGPASPWAERALLGFASALLAQNEWLDAAETLQQLLDASEPEACDESAHCTLARMRLTLIHRHIIGPMMGEKRWREARALSWQGPSLERPSGVAAREDGRLLIGDQRLGILDLPAGRGSAAVVISQQNLGLPSWDLDGSAVVAAGGRVLLPGERRAQVFGDPEKKNSPPLENISAVERGALGEWLVLTGKPERLLVFERDGEFRRALSLPDRADPVDMVQDAWGRIHVLDRKTGEVFKYSGADTGGRRLARARSKRPRALTADLLGNVYLLDDSARAIEIFDSAGASLGTLGPVLPGGIELREPVDVSVDGSGRLFVADRKLRAIVVIE